MVADSSWRSGEVVAGFAVGKAGQLRLAVTVGIGGDGLLHRGVVADVDDVAAVGDCRTVITLAAGTVGAVDETHAVAALQGSQNGRFIAGDGCGCPVAAGLDLHLGDQGAVTLGRT